MQNTPGNQDYPGINTLGSPYFLYICHQIVFCKPFLDACFEYTKKSTPRCIYHQGIVLNTGEEHTTAFKGTIILKIDCRLFDYLGTWDLCLKNCYTQGIVFNRLPSASPGSQLRIRITPRLFGKDLKSFLDMPN